MSWFVLRHLKGLCCPNRHQSVRRGCSPPLSGTGSRCCQAALFHKVSQNQWPWQFNLITRLFLTILTGLTGHHVLFLLFWCFFPPIRILYFPVLIFFLLNPWFHLHSSVKLWNFYLPYLCTDFLTALSEQSQWSLGSCTGSELGCAFVINHLLNCLCWEEAYSRDYRDGYSCWFLVYVLASVLMLHFIGWKYKI